MLGGLAQEGFCGGFESPVAVLFDSWYTSLENLRSHQGKGVSWLSQLTVQPVGEPPRQRELALGHRGDDCRPYPSKASRCICRATGAAGFIRVAADGFQGAAADRGTAGPSPMISEMILRSNSTGKPGAPSLGNRNVPPGPQAANRCGVGEMPCAVRQEGIPAESHPPVPSKPYMRQWKHSVPA